MTDGETSKSGLGVQGVRLGVLCMVLFGLGAATTWAAGLIWRGGTTIESGADELLGVTADSEWEQFFAGGDPAAGERLFFDAAEASRCGACHLFKDRGGTTGPNLTHAGQFPMRQLIRDIIDPMVTQPRGYEAITVLTTDGRVVSGLRQGRGDTLTVRRQDGEVVKIAPEEVEDAFAHSVMPTNYAEQLSLQDLRDLIALLRSAVENEPVVDASAAPSGGT